MCSITTTVALRKESVDRNARLLMYFWPFGRSLSARRAWIEIIRRTPLTRFCPVALRKESVDRNEGKLDADLWVLVALRKESVDRNFHYNLNLPSRPMSLSARRAWIEMSGCWLPDHSWWVALRKESVDRNLITLGGFGAGSVALRKESVDRNA